VTLAGLTLEEARRALAARFTDAKLDTPALDARLLIGHALALDLTGLVTQSSRRLSPEEASLIEGFAMRRLAHEPVARIIGSKEFWGLTLALSPQTLVPRPDTETVIEAALTLCDASQPLRIADLGTGSGAILLALLEEFRQATGVGTDISLDALRTARTNAAALNFSDRSSFIACDYASALKGRFDLLVSNPPYIRSAEIAALEPDVRDHDPVLALDGGPDGLAAYRVIAAAAAALLVPDGVLIVEVGHDQSEDVQAIMRQAGLLPTESAFHDLAGIPRAVAGRQPTTPRMPP
jgi:release factor glutamine methyltransferase